MLSECRRRELEALCKAFRRDVLTALHAVQTGHPGGSLSACEILAVLCLEEARLDPARPGWPARDKVVLCKGHAAPMLYRVLAERGFFPPQELLTLRQLGSRLQGHPCSGATPGVELTTGPLGQGYPAALGLALADRLDGRDSYTYAVLGDGELDEGVVWETCLNAAKLRADHLVTVVDCNGVQLDGRCDEILPLGDIAAKFRAFGYRAVPVDGHDVAALCGAIADAKAARGAPTAILAHTVKGKGVGFMEGKSAWHGRAVGDDAYAAAMRELGGAN